MGENINTSLQHTMRLKPVNPFSFIYECTHYVIPAWYSKGNVLYRVLRLGKGFGDIFVAEIMPNNVEKASVLEIAIYGIRKLADDEINEIKKTLYTCLHLNSKPSFELLNFAQSDEIIDAALKYNGSVANGKSYPELFEALCGVVCAQRAAFSRVPVMMGKIASNIAPAIIVNGNKFSAFPFACEIVEKGEDALLECGLGFRAKRVLKLAEYWERYELDSLYKRKDLNLIDELLKIPGVGPYTANLGLNLTGKFTSGQIKSKTEPHIDSYVCTIIGYFYFDGQIKSESETYKFVKKRWGAHAESILGYLTTDTEEWAAPLGFKLPVKSGAKAKYDN